MKVVVNVPIYILLATGAYASTEAPATPGASPELTFATLFLNTPTIGTDPLATASPVSAQPCLACALQSYMSMEMAHGRLQYIPVVFDQEFEDAFQALVRDEASQKSVSYENVLSSMVAILQDGVERRRGDRRGAKRAREILNTLFGSGTDRGIVGKTIDNLRELVKDIANGVAVSQSKVSEESAKTAALVESAKSAALVESVKSAAIASGQPLPNAKQDPQPQPPQPPKKQKRPPPPKNDDEDEGDDGNDGNGDDGGDGGDGGDNIDDQGDDDEKNQKKVPSPRPSGAPNPANWNKGSGGNAGSKSPPSNQGSKGNPSWNKGNPSWNKGNTNGSGSGNGSNGNQNNNGNRGNRDDDDSYDEDDDGDKGDKQDSRGNQEWHNV